MIKRYSVNKINKLSKNREVWCWGCGFQYGRMIKTYGNEFFVRQIQGLVDSDNELHGTKREINGRTIFIHSPKVLLRNKEKQYLLILSSDAYDAIYAKAAKIFQGIDIIYVVYPRFYSGLSNFLQYIFCKMQLKRQLLFYVGSNGSQPKDNADEIVRYLKEEYVGIPYDLVYLTDYYCEVPNGVKQICLSDVRSKSNIFRVLEYHYHYSRAKYIFFESEPIEKVRSDQKTFYLNHGTIPLKYVKDVLKQPESLNYAVCPGIGCTKFYEEQYSVSKGKLIYMMPPRVRRLFIEESTKVDKFLETDGKQMILWLPTFRKIERGDKSERRDSKAENPIFELIHSDSINDIDNVLRCNEQKLVVKCHPREKDDLVSDSKFTNIIIITDAEIEKSGISTHNLMNRADAMISDYSGATFEYMLLDRPLGYYIPDMKEYSRGFSVSDPLAYMPGAHMKCVLDLREFFDAVKLGKDEFSDKRRTLVQRLFEGTEPQKGAEELIDFLEEESL